MTKTLVLAAALFALPTTAGATDRSFERDGVTFAYSTARKGEHVVITGTTSTGADYRLTVRGKRVSGRFGSTPVSFTIDRPLGAPVETASID